MGEACEDKDEQNQPSSFATTGRLTLPAVVLSVRDDGFLEVLVEEEVKLVHRNYIVTPRIKSVKMTGGLK